MGIIDWIILVFLLLCIGMGFRRGLVGSLLQLGGYVLAFFLIGHYYPSIRYNMMAKYGINAILANILAIVLILVAILVLVKLVNFFICRVLSVLHLSWINHTLGGVLGLLNGLILVIIITVMIDFIPGLQPRIMGSGKHKVYQGVVVIKKDVYDKFGLKAKNKLLEYQKKKAAEAAEISIKIPKK